MNKFFSKEKQQAAKEHREAVLENYKAEKGVFSSYLKLVPKKHQWSLYQIYKGKNSMKLAIKMKCLDCAQFQRDEIRHCAVQTCPLHNFRPYQQKEK